MPQPVFRFAPSPNGHLHLGHALSALLNFDMARAAGGRFLLRMEDIDAARCRPEFEAAIYEDLAWLGYRGSSRCGGNPSISTTTARRSESSTAMRLTFPSFESRAEIAHMVGDRDVRERWPRDPDGVPLYPGAARQMKEPDAAGAHRARRALRHPPRHGEGDGMDRAAALERDRRRPVRRERRRSPPSPPPGATSSSAARRRRPAITCRSWSTTRCRASPMWCAGRICSGRPACTALLQALLDLPAPAYHHHRLILDADGRKLSKSTQATGLRELRAQGMTPADIRRLVGRRRVARAVAGVACSRCRGRGSRCRKPSAEAARQAQAARPPARNAPRAIEVALAGLAHDIRTPLTGILALSQLLQASDLPERERGWAEAIKDAAEHLARLTTLVVDAAKAGSTGLVLREEPFSPRELAQSVAGSLAARARGQGARRRDRHRQATCPAASAAMRCGCAARWKTWSTTR